jgi:dipeptidyl aminopeptidase/acylaminoacyl peptidase
MWGHSMGGYITLRSMVISKDIKAGVIWGGVIGSYSDMLTRWRRGPSAATTPTPSARSWRFSLINQYGSPEENPAFWNSISANSYLSDLSGPLQLHHGTADEEVPLEFSETLFYQMLDANQYVEFYKYEGDNHNISNSFGTAMQRSIEFFDRFVKNISS